MIDREGDIFQLQYGNLTIPFYIESGRRKQLSITVFPDLRVRVLAPDDTAMDTVLERVERRAQWIARQWRFFHAAPPRTPPRLYISGETHLYLGRQYRLKLRDIDGVQEKEGVKLAGRFFWIGTHDKKDAAHVKSLLDDWFLSHAKAIFKTRLSRCASSIHPLGLSVAPPLEVRRMAKRWGSCTPSGRVLLNLELVHTPIACIDYVIIHELCHLKIPHHNAEFYALLTRCLPDWESRKKRLETFGL